MKKRIISLIICAVMLLPSLTLSAAAVGTESAAKKAAGYFKKDDYFVISPAEKWSFIKDPNSHFAFKGVYKRVAVTTTEWELTAQHSGTANGNDIQTWKFGVSDKFYIENYEVRKSDGAGCFRIKNKGFRESDDGRFWDIEGRSKKAGGNVHLWSYKQSASQWFYLEEDGDGDPETFFLKNRNSNLYIVPRGYFKDPGKDCGVGKNSWSEEGCNLEQSNYAFRWRIQVLNRDAASDMGNTDKYADWMSLLPDDRYLSELNIPGTHDSSTANVEGSWNASYNYVACQKYFIEQQLYAGVRSLDLRTSWHDGTNDMVMVHSNFICHTPDHKNQDKNKTFRSVLDTIIRYLKKHPSEAVIVTLKIDSGDKSKGEQALVNILNDYTAKYSEYFYDWTAKKWGNSFSSAQKYMTSPTLGQARGKIVLMTRVDMSKGGSNNKLYSYTGPDLRKWDESYNDSLYYAQKVKSDSKVSVYIQDDYSSPDANKKTHVFNTVYQLNGNLNKNNKNLKDAAVIQPQDFVFNYTSKTNSENYGNTPLGAAKYMNDIIYNNSLFTPGSSEATANPRLGIVVMDYVNKQLCRRIIDRNSFPSSAAMKVSTVISSGTDAEKQNIVSDGQPVLRSAGVGLLSNGSGTQNDIIWPESAEITYGYVLGEAVLNFADNASGGKEGRFEFENSGEILPATKNGEAPAKQTLKFLPADGSDPVTREISVTVHRRYLPIKISNYEVEYGDTFSRQELTDTITITAGGYLLEKDLESLNTTIQKYKMRWLLRDSDGNEIPWPDVPQTDVIANGTIDIKAGVAIDPEEEFPNYSANVETGSWEVVPRTLTVERYSHEGKLYVNIGNVLSGDDVAAQIAEDGTLTLTGKKASYYQLSAADSITPEDTSAAYPSVDHITELTGVKAASCTDDGYTGDEICALCGKTVKVGTTVPAVGHSFKDGKCTNCGAIDNSKNAPSKQPNNTPETGDTADIAFWITLFCISGVAVAATAFGGKRKKHIQI